MKPIGLAPPAVLAICLGLGGATAAERALEKAVVVRATPEQVWAAWTTRDGIVSFFAPEARIEPRPGGLFEIQIDPAAAPGMRGADDMRFLALQPPRMLSFTWNAPPSLPEARQQRTVVIVRIAAADGEPGRSRVTLHHTGWGDGGEWDRAYTYFDRAWGNVLANLTKSFEQGPMDWRPWLKQLDEMRQKAQAAKPPN
jgi:uncharacterized protein YndB with AHSA1/START domain